MEERYRKAVSLAAAMLGRRSLSEEQLRKKLTEKELAPADVAYAIAYMKDLGAVDDTKFARIQAQSLADRGYGARRIAMTLQQKGIGREPAAEAAAAVTREDDQLMCFLEKRCHGVFPDRAMRQKVSAALVRKGFSYGEIEQAWEEYREKTEGEE